MLYSQQYSDIKKAKPNLWERIKLTLREGEFSDMTPMRKHRADYGIVICMGILMLLGLVVIYSIGPQRANVLNNAYGSNYSDMYFFVKQAISLGLALLAFIVMALLPYTKVTKHSSKLLIISIGACVALFLASLLNLGIAQKTLGATRWFNLGIFGSLQPAELLKFSMLVFLAGFIGRRAMQGRVNSLYDTFLPVGIISAIALFFIVVIQKDFGTGLSLVGIIGAMLFVGGISRKNGLRILGLAMIIGVLLIIIAPHRIERITTFMRGDDASSTSADDSDYQIKHAKIAIGTGGLFGVGIGNSVQATGYLPEAINDSVFAIMGETFGFVGLVAILAVFTAMLMRLLRLAEYLTDMRLKLIAAGVFGWFGAHVILNVASMVGIFPLTGITLPLLSFGGTSMVFIAAALGLAFQLSHYTVHKLNQKEATHEDLVSRRGVGRTRYPNGSSFTRN